MKGTLRLFLVLCITALSMTLVQAQERTYSGVVKGSDGQPIIGASVEVVGTTVGTSTGLDGDYTIKANQGSKIKYSFLGTKSVTVTAGGSTTINVTLEDDAMGLEEVVVQAFGTAKKKDLTGSVSSIDSKLISSQSNSTLSRALEGSIPGLQVASIDGQPGVDMGIRIRGIGSGTQNNSNALIVIDGVPNTNSNALSTLNPKDIESVTVLKDAASTALWGSRGANGVVMVTTKRGQQGKARVTFEGKWGMNMIGSNQAELMDSPADIYENAWQAIYNSARYGSNQNYTTNVQNPNMTHEEAALFASQHLFNYTGSRTTFDGKNPMSNWLLYNVPGLTAEENLIKTGSGSNASSTLKNIFLVGTDGKLNPNATLMYNDDWEDAVFQKSFRQEYNVTVSGATDKTDYFISAGYLSDPSYFVSSKFNRYNLRSNVNTQINKWLKAGVNIAYSRRAQQSMATRWGRNPGTTVQNVFYWLYARNALAQMWQRDENGALMYDEKTGEKIFVGNNGQQYSPLGYVNARYPANGYNLIQQLQDDKDQTIYNDLNMSGYVEAKFLKDFTFRANIAVDETFAMRERYANKETGASKSYGGTMGRNYSDYMNINSQQLLTWAHDYGKHHVDALIGHEFNWNRSSSLNFKSAYSLINGFDTFANFLWLNGGDSPFSGGGGGEDQEALEGYFARANYNFDNKYYVTASIRADGSSKFRYNDDRWGVFWSVGGAWRLSSEPWLADATWLTDLKLRADYGVIGNQNGIGRYAGYLTWSYGSTGNSTPGSFKPDGWKISQGSAAAALTWEKKKTVDVGLDFRLWDRFYGTLDWYQTNTTDMIWNAPTNYAATGQSSIAANSAELRTRGFEFELGVDIIKTPDILWSFGVNGAHYKTILTKVPEGTGSDKLNGMWEANPDGWTAAGTGTISNGAFYLRGVGKPYYNVYQYLYGGVDQATGLPLISSTVTSENIEALRASHYVGDLKEGNMVYTTNHSLATRQEIGDATPKLIGGFNTSFRWKDLDFAATFAFQIGGKFFSNSYALYYYDDTTPGYLVSEDLRNNTWTATNTSAKYPMMMYANPNGDSYTYGASIGSWAYTDMSLFDASYLSVKNITVGYNFPQKWMDKIGIGGIRVYASLDNMWLITSKSGIDPRQSLVGGMEVGAMGYPQMRTCSLGVNITF